MADLTFPITDKMIMTCREYGRLKNKHLKTKGMKVGDSDEYLKKLTSNAFRMLKDEVSDKYLKTNKTGGKSIDYTQWRWIMDIAQNRNKYWKLGERHGKLVGYSTRMEQQHTAQGKSGSPEIDTYEGALEKMGKNPVFDFTGIAEELSDFDHLDFETVDFDWECEKQIDQEMEKSIEAQYHANRRREKLNELNSN